MNEFLRNWIINIVTLIIFIIIVETLVPSDKFKKYVKLVTGLVLMVIIINPIVTLINHEYSLDQLAIKTFGSLGKNEISSSDNLGKVQSDQVISIYKQKLCENIKEKILEIGGINNADVNINIETDSNNKSFGSILSIDVTVYKSNSNTENIEVGAIDAKSQEQLASQIKQKLSPIYNISQDKINVKYKSN